MIQSDSSINKLINKQLTAMTAIISVIVFIFVWFNLSRPPQLVFNQLIFQDNNTFYETLAKKLESGERVAIKTPFTHYFDLPSRLQSVFPAQSNRLQDTRIPLHLSASRLVAIYTTSILGLGSVGAVVGAGIALATGNDPVAGAVIGGGAGASFGVATGAIIHAIESYHYKVTFLKLSPKTLSVIELAPGG